MNLDVYEAYIEESEKGGRRQELNPGHLRLEPPVLHLTARQSPTPTILNMYCTGGSERLSCTPGSHW